jgi:23S rRNA pseudouridine1911/1915/1917 synthase
VIKQQISTIIDPQFAGKRLDKVVVELFDGAYSRSRLSAWIRDGLVTIDGEAVMKPGHKLENGKKLELTVPEAEVPEPGSTLEPTIIYEDELLAVINKPAGLPMHANSVGDTQMCVSNWLVAKYGDNLPICQGKERPGIVHRLDRGTSGVLVVARTQQAYHHLSAQLADHSMGRRYKALCWGHFDAANGVVDAPIGRSDKVGIHPEYNIVIITRRVRSIEQINRFRTICSVNCINITTGDRILIRVVCS